MKKIKVFFGEKRLKDIYPYATRWEVFKYKLNKYLLKGFKMTYIAFFIASMISGAYILGTLVSPSVKTVFAEQIIPITEIPPVMKRIAQCESGNMHKKEGQVIFNANKNGTIDIGKYQINSIWNKKATELGLNLSEEKDNEKFAMWLYKNYGSEPWKFSAHCWTK